MTQRRMLWVALPADLGEVPHQADKAVCFGWDCQPDRDVAEAAAKGVSAKHGAASWCAKCRLFSEGLAPNNGSSLVLAELSQTFALRDPMWLSDWSIADRSFGTLDSDAVARLFRPEPFRTEAYPERVKTERKRFDALGEPSRESDRRARDASLAAFAFLERWCWCLYPTGPGASVLRSEAVLMPLSRPAGRSWLVTAALVWLPPLCFYTAGFLVGQSSAKW